MTHRNRPTIDLERKYLAQTTYTEDGQEKTTNLSDEHLTRQAARDLAGRYVLTLCAGTRRTGPVRVEAVGRDGWKVTLTDGTVETIDLAPVTA
jgi:hypothetical protein